MYVPSINPHSRQQKQLSGQSREPEKTSLIKAAIEEPVRQRYELPGFRAILDTARRIRVEINRR